MDSRTKITYPFAYIPPFTPINAKGAERRSDYLCFGCDQRLVYVKGTTGRAEHFRHWHDQEVSCLPDSSLHRMAQALIVQAFSAAVEQGNPYKCVLEKYWRCHDGPISVDLAGSGSTIASEQSVIEGTRSDLVVFKPDGTPRLIIEIVVTHDLETDTSQKYLTSQTPVVKVKDLTFETIHSLQSGISVKNWLNISKKQECPDCRDKRVQDEEKTLKRLAEVQSSIRISPIQSPPQITPITHVGVDGNLNKALRTAPLRSDTRRRLNRQAQQLSKLGFRQSQTRPTLFSLICGGWTIFADLDSTQVLFAWECEGPALYAFGNSNPKCRECLLEEVGNQLTQHGVEYRRHFMDNEGHNHTPE